MVLGDFRRVVCGGVMCFVVNMKSFVYHSAAEEWTQVCG